MLKKAFIAFLLCLFLTAVITAPVRASTSAEAASFARLRQATKAESVGRQEGIQVVRETTSFVFGQEIVFEITVNTKLNEATLFYRVEEEAKRRQQARINGEIAQIRIPLRAGEIFPASEVTYFWRLKDIHGNYLQTGKRSLLYLDQRFLWRDRTRGNTTVFWYKESGFLLVATLVQLDQSLAEIEDRLDLKLEKPIKIVLYQSWQDMKPAHGGAIPTTIICGTAHTGGRILMLNPCGWPATLTHELTHLLVHQLMGKLYDNLPFWLEEGLATYAEGDSTFSTFRTRELERAAAKGELASIFALTPQPRRQSEVNLFYAQAQSLITFLVEEKGGKEKIIQLLTVVGEGTLVDDALLVTYGFNRHELEKEWREWIGYPLPEPVKEAVKPEDRTAITISICIEVAVACFLLLTIFLLVIRTRHKQKRESKIQNPH